MKPIKTENIKNREQGSAMVLVLIGVLILSLIGASGISQSSTEFSISRNFLDDKETFFINDSGIHFGINELRSTVDPPSISFNQAVGKGTFKSGPLSSSSAENVEAFTSFAPPPPPGISLDISSGIKITGWNLTVSASIRRQGTYKTVTTTRARKEIQTVVVLLTSEY